MSLVDGLYVVAAILALISLIQSRGAALLAWAVLIVAIGLLWPLLPGVAK